MHRRSHASTMHANKTCNTSRTHLRRLTDVWRYLVTNDASYTFWQSNMAMENPRCMDDVPITTSFISIHRRFPIAMFDDQPQSVIDNTTSKPAIGHLSVPSLSQPCRCLLSSACACACSDCVLTPGESGIC